MKNFKFILLFFCVIFTYKCFCEETDKALDDDSLIFTITDQYVESINENSQDYIIIDNNKIEESNCQNITEILRKVANISIKQYGSYGSASSVYLRSFSGNAVAILINGIQVNSSQTGEFDLNKINIADVEKIEIVKGASDNKFTVSGAAGGIINIITKKETEKKIGFNFDISNLSYFGSKVFFDTQNVFSSFFHNTKKFSWNISSSYVSAKNNFLYYDINNEKKIRQNNEAKTGTVSTNATINFSDNKKFQFYQNFFWGNINTPGAITSTNLGYQEDTFYNNIFLFDLPFLFDGYTDTQFFLSYKYDKTNYDEDIGINIENNEKSLHKLHTINYINRWTIYFANNVTYYTSVDYSLDILDSTNCKKDFDKNILKSAFGFSNSLEINISNLNIYPSLKLLVQEKNIIPIPKINFTYFFSKNKTKNLNINIYRMFTFPTLNQLYWTESVYANGNPNLKNEDGYGIDIIYRFAKENITFDTSLFSMYYTDKIQWQNHNNKWTPKNIGEALYVGGYVGFNYIINKNFEFNFKYDLNISYLLTGEYTIKDNKRIMYTPTNIFTSNIIYNYKNLKLIFSCCFTGKRYISNLNINFLKEYIIFDIALNYKINEKINCYFTIKNLTNTTYEEIENYPMPNTSIKMGVKTKL